MKQAQRHERSSCGNDTACYILLPDQNIIGWKESFASRTDLVFLFSFPDEPSLQLSCCWPSSERRTERPRRPHARRGRVRRRRGGAADEPLVPSFSVFSKDWTKAWQLGRLLVVVDVKEISFAEELVVAMVSTRPSKHYDMAGKIKSNLEHTCVKIL